MSSSPLEEFLTLELDGYIRSELLAALTTPATGQRYFTYNAFNILLNADASTATVEDELDAKRQSVLDLHQSGTLLAAGNRSPKIVKASGLE